jgi:nucleotide-binding universal stress UspA family protein
MAARSKRVLVFYDGTDVARRALDTATSLMGYGSILTVANVAPEGSDAANDLLCEARERLLERQLTATYLPLQGDAVEELVGAARDIRADLVVVGGHNDNAQIPAIGSVSADVVRRAPCDVLVVR